MILPEHVDVFLDPLPKGNRRSKYAMINGGFELRTGRDDRGQG